MSIAHFNNVFYLIHKYYIESITINDFEDCVTQKCTSFLIQDTDTYNTLTIYLLLIFISELLEYYIVKYVVLSIVCIICCYIFAFLINYLLSIDKSKKKKKKKKKKKMNMYCLTYMSINSFKDRTIKCCIK